MLRCHMGIGLTADGLRIDWGIPSIGCGFTVRGERPIGMRKHKDFRAMTFYIRPWDQEVLLALAWAAPLTTQQLRRITQPALGRSSFYKALHRLRAHDLLQADWYYQRAFPSKPVSHVWSLTAAAFALVADHEQEPWKLAPATRALLEHDLQLSEVVTCVIERSRALLSGIYLQRELRLDDQRRRPRSDAIVIIRRSPHYALPHSVPWLTRPPAPEEQIRAYALEIDRDTEPVGIIREKAVSYSAVWSDSDFYRRYGKFPTPLWVVPAQRRLEAIMRAWIDAWPDGMWLIATDAGVQDDAWDEYRWGRRRTRTLLDGWELQPDEQHIDQ